MIRVLVFCLLLYASIAATISSIRLYLYDIEPSPGYELTNPTVYSDRFEPDSEIIVIILTETDSISPTWIKNMAEAYLDRKDPKYQVIIIEWTHGAENRYYSAVKNVGNVGIMVANKLMRLAATENFEIDRYHVLCHSISCHVTGFAGKYIYKSMRRKLVRLTALDATGPGFNERPSDRRLSKGDAEIVVALHTDCDHFGFTEPFGDLDFYTNGEECRRSPILWHKAIKSYNFEGTKCDSWKEFENGTCDDNKILNFAGDRYSIKKEDSGLYYTITNKKNPFLWNRKKVESFEDGAISKKIGNHFQEEDRKIKISIGHSTSSGKREQSSDLFKRRDLSSNISTGRTDKSSLISENIKNRVKRYIFPLLWKTKEKLTKSISTDETETDQSSMYSAINTKGYPSSFRKKRDVWTRPTNSSKQISKSSIDSAKNAEDSPSSCGKRKKVCTRPTALSTRVDVSNIDSSKNIADYPSLFGKIKDVSTKSSLPEGIEKPTDSSTQIDQRSIDSAKTSEDSPSFFGKIKNVSFKGIFSEEKTEKPTDSFTQINQSSIDSAKTSEDSPSFSGKIKNVSFEGIFPEEKTEKLTDSSTQINQSSIDSAKTSENSPSFFGKIKNVSFKGILPEEKTEKPTDSFRQINQSSLDSAKKTGDSPPSFGKKNNECTGPIDYSTQIDSSSFDSAKNTGNTPSCSRKFKGKSSENIISEESEQLIKTPMQIDPKKIQTKIILPEDTEQPNKSPTQIDPKKIQTNIFLPKETEKPNDFSMQFNIKSVEPIQNTVSFKNPTNYWTPGHEYYGYYPQMNGGHYSVGNVYRPQHYSNGYVYQPYSPYHQNLYY